MERLSSGEELYDLATDPDEKFTRANSEPERMKRACELFDATLELAERKRSRMGVTGDSETGLSQEELEQLRDVGYAH